MASDWVDQADNAVTRSNLPMDTAVPGDHDPTRESSTLPFGLAIIINHSVNHIPLAGTEKPHDVPHEPVWEMDAACHD